MDEELNAVNLFEFLKKIIILIFFQLLKNVVIPGGGVLPKVNRDFDLVSSMDPPVKHKKRAAKAQPVNKAYNIKNSTKNPLQLPKSTNVTTLSERNLNTG